MLVLKGQAELRKINLRMEAHGDAMMRAFDLRFIAKDIDAERIDSLIPKYKDWLYEKEAPILQEIYPLVIRHKIQNVNVDITAFKQSINLVGCDVSKIKMTPRTGFRCDLDFTIQASEFTDGILDLLSRWQGDLMDIEIVERQLELEEVAEA
jgi:hypothetical protein